MPKVDTDLETTVIAEVGGRLVAHHRNCMPWPCADRSSIVIYYRQDGPEPDEFNFGFSSRGCDDLEERYADNIGKDIRAEVETVMNFTPHDDGGTIVRLLLRSN